MSQPIKKTVGIVGGGQLGKMLIESAQKWNVDFNVLDAEGCPASKYAKHFFAGKLTDTEKINALSEVSDVLTYEIEHINADALLELEKNGKAVIPAPSILKIIQDKGKQKKFYQEHELPTTPFFICSVEELDTRSNQLQKLNGEMVVVKSCTGGYDGKGVYICERELCTTKHITQYFEGQILVEEFVDRGTELSVIVARSRSGEVVTYPVVEMVFDPKINLVDHLFAPAQISSSLDESSKQIAQEAIEKMDGIGLFAVELFLKQGKIFINEIAPRPHNSGHHTIEACYTSQYEQLARILLDLPLGSTDLLRPAVMTNIVGPEGVTGDYKLLGLEELHKVKGASLHWYNKSETRPGRKMGHFTVLSENLEEAIVESNNIRRALRIAPA